MIQRRSGLSAADIASFEPPFERRYAGQLQAACQELVGLAGIGWSNHSATGFIPPQFTSAKFC